MNTPAKGRRLIDRYLSQVERALAHHDPDERREILDGLRAHVYDELTNRTPSGSPSMDEVRAVLSGMDAPQSYRQQDEIEASIHVGRSRWLGRLGFYFFLGALGLFALSLVLGATISDALLRGGLMLSGMLGVCALGLGIAGWRDQFGKAAVIGALIALVAAVVMMPTHRVTSGPASPPPIVEAQTQPTGP